jgi:DNA helicase II / ATP-dependent DNA helicase PcrA
VKQTLLLTKSQEEAIGHYDGPALVVAGPGAGKTFVITERVKNLILNHKVSPKNILVTTFTEKAADELKIKLAKTIGRDAELIHISTVHSFCKTMLEKHFLHHEYGAEINVLDDESQTLFIQLNKVNIGISKWEDGILKNLKKRFDYISDIKRLYDQMTQNMIDSEKLIEELKDKSQLENNDEAIIKSYDEYCTLLRIDKRMDFSMLETTFYQLIENVPSVLEEIQDQFKFILVDEYQDTSPIQDKIFKKLSSKYHNLFVVGDENQSIYGFRGASIKNFKSFLTVFPKANSYFLDVNFRSTETIVNFSNQIFEGEVKKVLKAKRRKGEQFKILDGEDSDDSAKKTILLIKNLKEKGIIEKFGDVVLLFRSLKGHSPEFVKHLSKENIPFVTFGDGKFLERNEIRTIIYLMSYVTQELYLDNNFKKWTNWWRKDVFLSEFFDLEDSTKKVISDAGFNLYNLRDDDDFQKQGFTNKNDILILKKINKLKYDVQREKESFGDLEKGNNSLLKIFYKLIDYSGYFNRLMDKQDIQSKETLHNLGRLSEIIGKYMDISKKEDVKGFLWYIYSIDNKIDQKKIEDENTVKLMTVHQSKGLEFPVVFMCCMNEGRFPLRYWDRSMIKIPTLFLDKSELEDDQEVFFQEERRLFYVGLTRAQDLLVFTTSNKIITQNSKRSRFLEVVQEEISEEEFKLPIEKKYTVNKKVPSLNYSSINTFIDCPLRYTLIYDYGFVTPPSFMQNLGTFIHNVLQRIHERMKNNVSISPSEMKEIVTGYWIDLPMGKERNSKIRDKLTKEFVAYYIKVKDEYEEILAIEESFSHIDDDMIIKGKVDLIVKDKKGNIDLIDFKARKQKGIEETNVDKQLQIYSYCLDGEYDITKLFAHTFRDNQRTEFSMDKEGTKDFLKKISKKINQEDFHKQKNPFCKDCQFKFYCWGESQ